MDEAEVAEYIQNASPAIAALMKAIDQWADHDDEYPICPVKLEGSIARVVVHLQNGAVLHWRGNVAALKEACEAGIRNLQALNDEKGMLTSDDVASII